MPYIASDGRMLERKPFGIGMITDYFWSAVNMVQLFFRGLLHMDDPRPSRGQYGNPNHRVPGRRGMGGVRGTGGVAAPPCVGGG